MKTTICCLLLLLAGSTLGQDVKPTTAAEQAMNWSKLGPTIEGARGFTLHGRGIRINKEGQYELWVKIVPENKADFSKRYGVPRNADHVLQYATVDCEKRSLFFEKTSVFDGSGGPIESKTNLLTPSKKDAVKPGSIGEALYKYVCIETTALPLTVK
ncbi:MAG: hypothetical protein AB7Q37_17145 [Pyrinomonadaceae bacterium]